MTPGMNLFLWTDHVTEAQRPAIALLAALGYGAIEIPVLEASDPAHYRRVRSWLDEAGFARRSAAGGMDAAHDPSSADPAIRQAAKERIVAMATCAAEAGATLLIGPLYGPLGVFTGQPPTAEERARAMDVIRAAAESCAALGVRLGIESLNRYECHLLNTTDAGAAFVRDVAHPQVVLMHDTYHAHIEEKDPAAAIARNLDVIAHVHVSENDRGTPGTGQVRWAESFRALKHGGYDGVLMIEAFGLALPRLAAACRIWRPMFEDEGQLARDGIAFIRRAWAAA
jgi:D-psicose/D-tagatose/L-ribulose 3-epimerase